MQLSMLDGLHPRSLRRAFSSDAVTPLTVAAHEQTVEPRFSKAQQSGSI